MNNENRNQDDTDLSPVDEVRRIRERLSEECGNDVRALAERVREIGERVRREYEVKEVKGI